MSYRYQRPSSSLGWLRWILQRPKLPSTHIPEPVLDRIKGSTNQPLKYVKQYRKEEIRQNFATFGRNSGLKAGVCWPTKEELQFMKQYEEKFEKSIVEMRENLRKTKLEEKKRKSARETEIINNLKKLPKMKEEFWKNYYELHSNIKNEKLKSEKIIEEVREYLGYDIDPNDPRFEEALAKKDEEKKAALKAARKLERQRQTMELLQAMVSEALEKEKPQQPKNLNEDKKSENKNEENSGKTT